jgi:hypothetical protein
MVLGIVHLNQKKENFPIRQEIRDLGSTHHFLMMQANGFLYQS